MTATIRLRKRLSDADTSPYWPAGIRLQPISAVDPDDLHALLVASYADGAGTVPPLPEWWPSITSDEEYDPELVFVAVDAAGTVVGVTLCWTSGFVKDFAVDASMRGRGIGQALVGTAFAAFQQRGLAQVDLKAMSDNVTAIRLYHHLGMVEVPL